MINQEKKFGYIQTKDQSYYFRFQEFKSSKYLIRVGVDVGFYLVEGFDKKKNQVSLNAVEIRQI
jgi:cold shock CspA family protein